MTPSVVDYSSMHSRSKFRPTSRGSGILSKASEHELTTMKQAFNTRKNFVIDSLEKILNSLKPKVRCGTKRATLISWTKVNWNFYKVSSSGSGF